MMGSIDAWFYKYLAGIQLDDKNPAFASFQVKPLPLDNLGTAKGRIETIRGTVSSEWKKINGQFTLKLEVPFNTSAIVYIPGNQGDEVKEGGLPISRVSDIENLGYKEGACWVKVHSGNYVFTMNKK